MLISYTDLYDLVKSRIKSSRFEHSVGVAETAKSLAERFNVNTMDALYCGIYHDAYRYSADESAIEFCIKSGWSVLPEERMFPDLLHGTLAAIHFPEDAGDVPFSYQLAVRHHTLGSVDMGRLGALIYIADYIEPGRKHLTDDDRRIILSNPTLESMIISIMDMQREYFISKGIKEAEVSKELYDFCARGGKLE